VTVSLLAVLSALYKYNNDFEGSSVARLVERRAKTRPPPRKNIIWLFGYPGAGSDATINMIERLTSKSMATNYGATVQTRDMASHTNVYTSEWLQKSWWKEGVFINNRDYPADTPEVYVKTHCTGYCLYEEGSGFCMREPYVRDLVKKQAFWEDCARGDVYLPPRTRRWNKTYWKRKVFKVLVLVRNPMELVTSRYLKYARVNGSKFGRVGLLPYCQMIDTLYGDMKEFYKITTKKRMKEHFKKGTIPCYTEFFRIYYWYHNVYYIASRREVMVKYYEDFINDPEGTALDILDYGGLERVEGKEIIPIGDKVEVWFTDEEKERIADFMQSLGRFKRLMWPEYFARYF
jgi:hypothetical protein